MSIDQNEFWEGKPYSLRLTIEEYLYFRNKGDEDKTLHFVAAHNDVDIYLAKKTLREFVDNGFQNNGWWTNVPKYNRCPKCGALLP